MVKACHYPKLFTCARFLPPRSGLMNDRVDLRKGAMNDRADLRKGAMNDHADPWVETHG